MVAVVAALCMLTLSACGVPWGQDAQNAATTERVETTPAPPTDATTLSMPQSSDSTTIVGAVETIIGGDQGGDCRDSRTALTCGAWWNYRLASGVGFSVRSGALESWCGSAVPPTSVEARPEQCAVVALVDDAGVASVVKYLRILQGEDAEDYESLTGGRPAGLLQVEDVSHFGDTEIITAEGFTFETSTTAVRECDPRKSPTPYGYEVLLDLDTSKVLYFGCLNTL